MNTENFKNLLRLVLNLFCSPQGRLALQNKEMGLKTNATATTLPYNTNAAWAHQFARLMWRCGVQC